jgi:hypothetical protein
LNGIHSLVALLSRRQPKSKQRIKIAQKGVKTNRRNHGKTPFFLAIIVYQGVFLWHLRLELTVLSWDFEELLIAQLLKISGENNQFKF